MSIPTIQSSTPIIYVPPKDTVTTTHFLFIALSIIGIVAAVTTISPYYQPTLRTVMIAGSSSTLALTLGHAIFKSCSEPEPNWDKYRSD